DELPLQSAQAKFADAEVRRDVLGLVVRAEKLCLLVLFIPKDAHAEKDALPPHRGKERPRLVLLRRLGIGARGLVEKVEATVEVAVVLHPAGPHAFDGWIRQLRRFFGSDALAQRFPHLLEDAQAVAETQKQQLKDDENAQHDLARRWPRSLVHGRVIV